MGYAEVMATPVRAFWAMANNINRICAEDELRKSLMFASSQATAEGQEEYRKALTAEIGPVFVRPINLDEEPDREGVDFLKGMTGA